MNPDTSDRAPLYTAAADLLAALVAIQKEARKSTPDPDKIYALATDAICKARWP